MHDTPLTISSVLRRMRTVGGASEVATLRGEAITRTTYAEVGERAQRLAAALHALDVQQGDRVATFMWNNQEHLELYYAVPSMGAILHTLNLRLFPEQLTYIVDHAEDHVIVVDDSVLPVIAPHAASMGSVRHWVIVGDGPADGLPGEVHRYEDLIAGAPDGYEFPELEDRTAAALCYTSGTTGHPKGVLYSHRSTVMHALGASMADTIGVCANDRVLPIVPMFHAMAWGTPYAAGLTGADLVMPGPHLQAAPLTRLITEEHVTVAAGVPTIWLDFLRHADEVKPDLSGLRMVLCGGAAIPRSLMQGFDERHNVKMVQGWGMTETSPLGAVSNPPRGVEGAEALEYRIRQGRISPLIEARLIGEDGSEQPWDNVATGELEVRGPWVANAYYRAEPGDVKFSDDGWLRTGDVAAIDPQGYMRITDRAKDVIKSGGEWISSVELENELMGHPAVAEAAVIAKPDERWTERPLACVVLREGAQADAAELAAHLQGLVARWWVPDEYAFIGEIPKTSVGKFDKKVLRGQLESGELVGRQAVDLKALA